MKKTICANSLAWHSMNTRPACHYFSPPLPTQIANRLRRKRHQRGDFPGRSTARIANTRHLSERSQGWESCGCGCGFGRASVTDRFAAKRAARLLQSIDGVHHALESRLVDQIERALLAWKHFQCQTAGCGNHSGGLFGGEVAFRDRFKRELNKDAQ